MRKILSIMLVFCLMLSLAACGQTAGGQADTQPEAKGQFMVGFGVADTTPEESVPLQGYGDAQNRFSVGLYTYLEAEALAVKDENGELVVFVVMDLTYAPEAIGTILRKDLSVELGVPESHIILNGTHTHASVATYLTSAPSVTRYNEKLINGVKQAVRDAVADLKPAEMYAGSVMTEGLNFVKRYIMDDGSLIADQYPGTGTKIIRHESEADRELQLLKFVREGGKDILIANFQTHPHFDGKHNNVSGEIVTAFREAFKMKKDAYCIYWQGAAGNLNSKSRLPEENLFKTRNEWGEKLADYAVSIYDSLEKMETGSVKVMDMNYTARVNHEYDHLLNEAQTVCDVFAQTYSTEAALECAKNLGVGIHSYYHASRIVSNAKLPDNKDVYIVAWSIGDVGGVVMAQEMYDTTGMILKEESPFKRTFIMSYAWPAYGCYIPTKEAYEVGGYEADNSIFAPGTAEELTAEYLRMLNEMHK